MIGNAEIGFRCLRDFPTTLDRLPLRGELDHRCLSRSLVGRGGRHRSLGQGDPVDRRLLLSFELCLVDQPGLGGLERRPKSRSLFRELDLHGGQPLVAEEPAQKLCSPRRLQSRHESQLLLLGEIGVEELLFRHPEQPAHLVGHRSGAVGHRHVVAILVQGRLVKRTDHPVLMDPQHELEFDFDSRSRRCIAPTNRIEGAPGGRRAVHGPRNRFEQGRLPRPVRSDDPGQPRLEFERGIGVLPKIDQPEPAESHQASGSGSKLTDSSSVTPRSTKRSRSRRSGSGRRAK